MKYLSCHHLVTFQGFQLSFNHMVAKKWAKSKSELQLPLEDHIDGMLYFSAFSLSCGIVIQCKKTDAS